MAMVLTLTRGPSRALEDDCSLHRTGSLFFKLDGKTSESDPEIHDDHYGLILDISRHLEIYQAFFVDPMSGYHF